MKAKPAHSACDELDPVVRTERLLSSEPSALRIGP